MLYRTFETNMNFYLDHIFYYVLVRYDTYRCQFTLLLLWCWTIKSTKKHNYYKHMHMYLFI